MSPENDARAYAQAFYEAAVGRWLAVLDGIAQRLEQDPNLRQRLEGDRDEARQRALLDGMLPGDVDMPVRNLLYLLLERGGLSLLPGIAEELRERMAQAAGPTAVDVVSAVPLTDTECGALQEKLQSQFGNNIAVRYRVDPAILGGLIIRAGDKLIDGSVATRLAALRQSLGVATNEARP